MNILPIKLITDEDQPVFGVNAANLAKLARSGFPVASGFVICPPQIFLQTILRHIVQSDKEIFEQRLEIIKREIRKIPLPEKLEKEMGKTENFYLHGKLVNKKKELWFLLLETWINELRSRIWRGGFGEDITLNLTPQFVVLLTKISKRQALLRGLARKIKKTAVLVSVTAHIDPEEKEVIIKSTVKLTPPQLKVVDETVLAANKRLFLPQTYQFLIVEDKVVVVGISPFTQSLPASKDQDVVLPKKQQQRLVKTAVKLFLNLSSGFAIETGVDGILIEGERVDGFDETVFKLTEGALTFPEKPVIYKLPDILQGDIRGALRLLHDKKLMQTSSEAFIFARHKKNLLNLEIALPYVRSCEEFLQLKRELAVKGITRKGSLKLWLELAIPENIINLESYLTAGLSGVILNLDELQKLLGGHGLEAGEFYRKEVQSLIKFIQPIFKVLHKAGVPVLTKGELTLYPDIIECLISEGVYGVVVNTLVEAHSVPEHLHWAEKRMVEKRLYSNLN